jgi:hypothetical protein
VVIGYGFLVKIEGIDAPTEEELPTSSENPLPSLR